MKIRTINSNDLTRLKYFVSLERKLLSHHKNYISPIDEDVIGLLTKKSHLYTDVEFKLFIVSKNNEDVGRCAAIINSKYQRDKNESVGSIGFFAAAPNCNDEIKQLLQEAENWLQQEGVKRIIAPWDGVNAADSLYFPSHESPMFPIPWHPDYYFEYLRNSGYKIKCERFDFEIDFSSEKYKSAKEKYINPNGFTVRTIYKNCWDRDIEIIRKLFNETFKNEWESYIYTSDEFSELFESSKSLVDANHILIAEERNIPIGFCFGITDLTPIFRSFNGVLESKEIEKLIAEVGNYKRAAAFGIGVLPTYKGKGVSKSLLVKLYDSFEKHGLKKGSYFLVNDYNIASRKLAESFGGNGRIMSRCLDKILVE